MSAEIFVRFSWFAVHSWPAAPDRRAYLRYPHRHRFDVEVKTTVEHNDREIEFHDLIDEARSLMPGSDFGSSSCEAVAELLCTALSERYRRRFIVSVSEESEAGATVDSHQGRAGSGSS